MRPIFRSKNELVYDALKQAILQSELAPGQRLVIDDLAAAMGVSPIPVREALRQLEADGFVSIEPYVGATVTPIHVGLITEIFALLEGLEVISSRAACAVMTEDDVRILEARIVAMDALIDKPDDWSAENTRLHLFICQRAGMGLVERMMATAFDHWDRLRRFYLKDVSGHRIAAAQQEHHELFAAFVARDPDGIERIIREHNRGALAAYVQQLPAQP